MSDEPDHDFPRAIGRPATGALLHAGYTSLEQLNGVPRTTIAGLHGVGPKALGILQGTLEQQGRSLA